MAFPRLNALSWSQLVTALLLLLAFPALQAAAIFQLMDRVAGTSFFLTTGLTHMTYAALALAVFQIPVVIRSIRRWRLRPDTGTSAAKLGMWLFLAYEAMFFASLFAGYAMLRAGSLTWPDRFEGFPGLGTVLLVGASAAFGTSRFRLIGSHALAFAFVAIKIGNDVLMIRRGATPASNLMLASWYALTWVHAFHVFAGAIFTGWLAGPSFRMAEEQRERWLARIEATRMYWLFVDLVWLAIVIGFFFV